MATWLRVVATKRRTCISSMVACCVLVTFSIPLQTTVRGAPKPATAPTPIRFYVSPRGNDAGPGTATKPFLTLTRAQGAVRNAVPTMQADVEVHLFSGTYRLKSALVMDARDSGRNGHRVIWMADAGQHPVLSGAERVGGWTLYDRTRSIWRARVPIGIQTRQLYVNGRRAIRARSHGVPTGIKKTATGYTWPGPTMASWRHRDDIEMVSEWGWKMFRCPVNSISGATITMQEPCWHNANVFFPTFSMGIPTWVENAYELLRQPGQWYLDYHRGWLYVIPHSREPLNSADVEIPVAQTLIEGRGTITSPVHDVRFTGLTFSYATWLETSGPQGYADDQTGLRVLGAHQPRTWSHAENVTPTPGNVQFIYDHHIEFLSNAFLHLGAVGLYLSTGSQNDRVSGNHFEDISSAGIQLGGVAATVDAHPANPSQVTRDNGIDNNVVTRVGREYADAAGIFVGYATRTIISHNELSHLSYDGIAIGWGFGMTDPGQFQGCFGCPLLKWPVYSTPTTSRENRIISNRIFDFLQTLYDGGAVYILGQQGVDARHGMLVSQNVAYGKSPSHGGNVLYTDAGSRYITFEQNATYNNTPGLYGPGGVQWGRDAGGCRPRGDILFHNNWWQYPDSGYPQTQKVCAPPYVPKNVVFTDNTKISGANDVPTSILQGAGLQTH